MTTLTIKRGASFGASLSCLSQGVLTAWATLTITAQVRDVLGNLVEALIVTKSATPGLATLQSAGTDVWPIGLLRCDLRLVSLSPVGVDYSETFGIAVQNQVTLP